MCTPVTEPVTQPTKVETDMATASVAIRASGGRPPVTRQAMPTSIAPAPIVTPHTGLPIAIPMVRTATTGTAASSPASKDTSLRSKRAASRTARLTATVVPSGRLVCGGVAVVIYL